MKKNKIFCHLFVLILLTEIDCSSIIYNNYKEKSFAIKSFFPILHDDLKYNFPSSAHYLSTNYNVIDGKIATNFEIPVAFSRRNQDEYSGTMGNPFLGLEYYLGKQAYLIFHAGTIIPIIKEISKNARNIGLLSDIENRSAFGLANRIIIGVNLGMEIFESINIESDLFVRIFQYKRAKPLINFQISKKFHSSHLLIKYFKDDFWYISEYLNEVKFFDIPFLKLEYSQYINKFDLATNISFPMDQIINKSTIGIHWKYKM